MNRDPAAYLEFAERECAKQPLLDGVAPREVNCIAVIGAGTMGSGIAIAAMEAGYDVLLVEQDEEALKRGIKRIGDHYERRVMAGKVDASQAAEAQSRLWAGTDWSVLRRADLVIEAVFEDLAVKQQVFARLQELTKAGAVLASNTSYLDLDAIARSVSRPEDVIGLHFFSPANVMRLVEVVRGTHSAPDAVATALAAVQRMRKLPVVVGNAFGFVGNRIFSAYRRQCEFMLEEGAWPEQVDSALESFGFAMGPFAVADLSGLDIAWRMRKSQAATRDPATRYVRIPDLLCEAGRLGRKTGAGYYAYDDGKTRHSDPAVRILIERASAEKGRGRRTLDESEIQRRALLAMVNEAALLLAEDVARRATDIDVVMANGFGFPRTRGGPVYWARERGAESLANDMDWLADLSGPGFVRGDLRRLMARETGIEEAST
jgi:3-hydroxyacyl-CoA dehydrogenase